MINEIIIPNSLQKKIKKLPIQVRKKFYRCVDMLTNNENHPSLRHKKIEGTNEYWEFSITMNYRCVYRKESDKAFIMEIGKHEDIF